MFEIKERRTSKKYFRISYYERKSIYNPKMRTLLLVLTLLTVFGNNYLRVANDIIFDSVYYLSHITFSLSRSL